MHPIILASASPRRIELLNQLGLDFQVIPGEVSEVIPEKSTAPQELVTKLALHKASDIAGKVERGLVIGADTLVVLEGIIFGKPSGPDKPSKMLSMLSGKFHSVYTGIAVVQVPSGRTGGGYSKPKWSLIVIQREIRSMWLPGNLLDKAGAYGIQGKGGVLVERSKVVILM